MRSIEEARLQVVAACQDVALQENTAHSVHIKACGYWVAVSRAEAVWERSSGWTRPDNRRHVSNVGIAFSNHHLDLTLRDINDVILDRQLARLKRHEASDRDDIHRWL